MLIKMPIKSLVMLFCLFLAFGCSKKPPAAEEASPEASTTQPTEPVPESNVVNKDLSFDPQGSDSGNISGLFTIHFKYDNSTLTAEGRSQAQKNAQWMKDNPDVHLQIEGHCDRHGSTEYNIALGERRARAVKAYMINLGAKANRLSVISYGIEKLMDSSEAESADGKNRRANFVVQGK